MPKVFLICGKICSGKSTYADELRKEYHAVILSVDEITLALFGQNAGDRLDAYVEKTKAYLYKKSLEIISTGINVVIDWGFWTRMEREYARQFYSSRNVETVFCYIDVDPEQWQERIHSRNAAALAHESNTYYVDESLAEKAAALFEMPDKQEMDIWLTQ